MFCLILQVTKTVVVTFHCSGTDLEPTNIIDQCGIMFNQYVITVMNELPLLHKQFQITSTFVSYRDDEGMTVQNEYKFGHLWVSDELKKLLIADGRQPCIECDAIATAMSTFMLLCPISLCGDSCLERFVNMMDNTFTYANFNIGQQITTLYTPFGDLFFYDTLGTGCISNVYGRNKALFITDSNIVSPFQGAPVFM